MTGVAQVAISHQANGSLVSRGGKVIGSSLAAQSFSFAGYFHERPSATSPAYNAGVHDLLEPRPDEPGARASSSSRTPTAILKLEGPYNPGPHDPPDPGRRRRPVRLGDRPGDLDRLREPAGSSRRRGPPPAARDRAAADQAAHRQRSLGFFGEPGVNVLELNLAWSSQAGRAADGAPRDQHVLARPRPRRRSATRSRSSTRGCS